MRDDHGEGKGLDHPEFRNLFTREYLLASDWYQERLKAKQTIDLRLWRHHVGYLKAFLNKATHQDEAERLGIHGRLTYAEQELERVKSPAYLEHLHGTIGAEPSIAAKLAR